MKYNYWDPRLELTNHYETRKLIEYIAYKNNISFDEKVIVDIGCGWGTNAIILACGVAKAGSWQVPKQVIGIDYDSDEIKAASNTTKHITNIGFKCHDIRTTFPIDSKSVDIIYSTYTLHNLPDEEKVFVFREIARTLKVDGSFVYIDVLFDNESDRMAISTSETLEKKWRREAIDLENEEMQVLLDIHMNPNHPFSLLLTGQQEFPILTSTAEVIAATAGLSLQETISVRGLVCCKRMLFTKQQV